MHSTGCFDRIGKRIFRCLAGFQQLPDLLLRARVEAASRLSDVDQPASFIEPEDKGAEVLA